MSAFNIVRMRVLPEFVDEVERFYRERPLDMPGLRAMTLVRTGEREYTLIGEWDDMAAIVAARPRMLASLDAHRHKLEALGAGLGVTDAVSGEAVVERRA